VKYFYHKEILAAIKEKRKRWICMDYDGHSCDLF